MREPLRWVLAPGPTRPVGEVIEAIRRAAVGVADLSWTPPSWLHPHQVEAACRIAGSLTVFRGALLADAVGLGKTYVAIAVATRYPTCTVAVPATLVTQWRRRAECLDLEVRIISHEALSRGHPLPRADLVVVDEAHRFRNPATRRYDTLARGIGVAHVLLLTATPVVNVARDLVHLARLFLADHALAPLGVASLERAADGPAAALLHALAPLIVARSPVDVDACVPAARGGAVERAPPLAPERLERVCCALDALRFPSFGADAAGLLRQHVYARLASSWPACRETLTRHRTYLRRAAAAARRGERLSRTAARAVFGADDDAQLLLPDLDATGPPLDTRAIAREQAILARLLADERVGEVDPKAGTLCRLVSARAGKTLVFCGARATAVHLARVLGWRRVAVVASAAARIASGRIARDEAFNLFAPRARGRRAPGPVARVDVLIATDLASEGLDLQDADFLVNYDLPWTPLRLEQRIGRIVRLGSPHAAVGIVWFAPCAALERELHLDQRLHRKLSTQRALGVSVSSAPGHARVVGGALAARERILRLKPPTPPCAASARGVAPDVIALGWPTPTGTVFEVFLWNRNGNVPGIGFDDIERELRCWRGMTDAACSRPRAVHAALCALVRRRLSGFADGPTHPVMRRLVAEILKRAVDAGRRRDGALLDLLDRALTLVRGGLTVGAERGLRDALDAADPRGPLGKWLSDTRPAAPVFEPPRLIAWLAGM